MNKITHLPTRDPRLGWFSEHDPRSLAFASREIIPTMDRPRFWTPGPVLDQGREGSCVGHGWTGELLASPMPSQALTAAQGHSYAVGVYREAQQRDEWPGEDYEGTSVLAGAKTIQSRGFIGSYRWAFGIDEVRDAVVSEGPVVIGIPWYSSMYETRPSGLVDVDGDVVGGHCLLLDGYHPKMRIKGEGWLARHRVFRWLNSWGPDYGIRGHGFIRYDDLALLLAKIGEACVPMQRHRVRFSN